MNNFGVVGPALSKCLDLAKKLLETSGPILLIGKPGSGKDHFAKLIHTHILGKPENTFQIQNCARPQQTLLEEICGSVDLDESNVWDDAETITLGRLDLASQGTLYLDNIHLTSRDGLELITSILSGKPFYSKNSRMPRVQDNVRIIASCIPHPFDGELGYMPDRFLTFFEKRFIVLPGLGQRKEEIPDFVQYFCENELQGAIEQVPHFHVENELIENAERIFDNLRGLKAIAKRYVSQNPEGGIVSWKLAYEYIEKKIKHQSFDDQLRYRCEQMSFNLRYQGEPLTGDKCYSWIKQFDGFQGQISSSPTDIGETLLKHICERYFFTESKLILLLEQMQEEVVREIEREISKQRSPAELARYTAASLEERNREEALSLASKVIVTAPLGPMKSSDAVTVDYGISLHKLSLSYRKLTGLLPKVNACEFEKLGEWYSSQTTDARVVILDDFIGSGMQIETVVRKIKENQNLFTAYRNHRQKPNLKIYLLICVAFEEGIIRARRAIKSTPNWIEIVLIHGNLLNKKDMPFQKESSIFVNSTVRKDAENLIVELIGKRIYPRAPRGFESVESVVVFEHNIPNDSLPVLYKDFSQGEWKWRAIFPRMKTSEIKTG